MTASSEAMTGKAVSILNRRSERGSVLLITSAVIMALIAMLALSIDLGYVLSRRSQLQGGLDAAALAAAAGLRAAIEPAGSHLEQDKIVRELAKKYASYNQVHRYGALTNDQGEPVPNPANNISLSDADIVPEHEAQPPRVRITHHLSIPTIFASIFGFSSIDVSAGSVASTMPVDGGTGMISGCWRPLLLPDTFFDAEGQVWAVGQRPTYPWPDRAGDYYRSRFATSSGPRSGFPFVDSWTGTAGAEITSIRDAKTSNELKLNGGKNLIGWQPILLRPGDWRLVDFATTYPGSVQGLEAEPWYQIKFGHCWSIRVGEEVEVHPLPVPPGTPLYGAPKYGDALLLGLLWLRNEPAYGGIIDIQLGFHYVSSLNYKTANTNPRIIPVLLCDPMELVRRPFESRYRVTNIGAFFVDLVSPAGDLGGFFVRELVVGGLPLQPENSQVTDPNLLPASVQIRR